MKEAKSSFGSAVRTLRGNVLIKLLMMLEMPTASESSISILKVKMKIIRNRWDTTCNLHHTTIPPPYLRPPDTLEYKPAVVQNKLSVHYGPSLYHLSTDNPHLEFICSWKNLQEQVYLNSAGLANTPPEFLSSGNTSISFPLCVVEVHLRSAFPYAPNCDSNPYQMDLNCKQKSSITADWRTCRMVFR